MKNVVSNEKGMALIVAVCMIAILSILAAVMMNSTTNEVQISGNYMGKQRAFNMASRAMEYALENIATGTGTINLTQAPYLASFTTLHLALGDSPNENAVTYIGGTQLAPPGSGNEVQNPNEATVPFNYYSFSIEGIYPQGSPNPFRADLRAEVAKEQQ